MEYNKKIWFIINEHINIEGDCKIFTKLYIELNHSTGEYQINFK